MTKCIHDEALCKTCAKHTKVKSIETHWADGRPRCSFPCVRDGKPACKNWEAKHE